MFRDELVKFFAEFDFKEVKKPNSKPLTQKELSYYLGLSDQTVTRWRNKGRIPFIKIGPSIRYNLDEVLKAIEVSKSKSS